ncbi:glycosyltransferase family 28 domain-containing protein [Truncatella angustata]|uniref:Glycosyltransferase family 28 domain-containing protein n=1 Tax=Truncatella angustata TaxID=152316 RepID=A0A9P8RF56_9PEZI|nr:glycosyltransferase family 28 domain-containing protein [Truncatella angustata]KAH6643326.1 glycosyltransferase family 28 domain-containing protein [Truncatella angustata]
MDARPPNELCSLGHVLNSSAAIQADGSIEIAFSSSDPQAVTQLIPALPPSKHDFQVAPSDEKCLALNIVIQVVGSRGDVQPFIAYGIALQRQGHRVRLATHNIFENFVKDAGLEFYAIGGDPLDLMAYMVKNPGLIPSLESLKGGDIGRKRAMVKEILRGCWLSCIAADPVSGVPFVADAIVANPPSFAHVHCAQALGIPLHIMFTMPWTATRAFPHPLANIRQADLEPAAANWLSYGMVGLMTWQGLGDVINAWRKQDLQLEQIATSMGPSLVEYLRIPHTYCWSPALVAKPADWGSEIDVCGFFMRDEPQYIAPPDLKVFLATGSPPLYVGFGSIVLDDPKRLTNIILEATRICGVRVLISRGWSELGKDSCNSSDVFYLDDCPHEWLFKRVSAVIHHGGAGTTACGLVNARPTIIVPFFGDQPFWADVVAKAGAGTKPIPQKQLTVERLVEAIKFAISPAANVAAQKLAAKMRRESGVDTAVASFHRALPTPEMRCEIVPGQVARWVLDTKGRRRVRISDAAVAVLIVQKKIQINQLKSLRSKEYDTDVQRWDPVSGGAASILGTMTDFSKALGGVFIDPFKSYKRVGEKGDGESAAGVALTEVGDRLGSMAGVVTKGALVDMPLALAEGLKNVPRLYGEEIQDHGTVNDWQSGSKVAAKNFGSGFYHGITGFITQPYKGAKEEGTVGFLKGAGKGTMGLFTKPGAAMFGLMAYPAQGIFKSIEATKTVDRSILQAKCAMVDKLAADGKTDVQVDQVVHAFDMLR